MRLFFCSLTLVIQDLVSGQWEPNATNTMFLRISILKSGLLDDIIRAQPEFWLAGEAKP